MSSDMGSVPDPNMTSLKATI